MRSVNSRDIPKIMNYKTDRLKTIQSLDIPLMTTPRKLVIFASLYLTDGSLSPQLSFLNKSRPQTRFIAAWRKELNIIRTEGSLFVISTYIKC